jgi:hypothetical protein
MIALYFLFGNQETRIPARELNSMAPTRKDTKGAGRSPRC